MVLAAKLEETIELPEGVTAEVSRDHIKIIGPKGQLGERFKLGNIRMIKADSKIHLVCTFPKKPQKAMLGTLVGRINNMIKGVTHGYEYKLQVIYSHFPMNVSVQNDKVIIKNFLGEKHPRTSRIVGNTQVKVKGQDITVNGINKEEVGQTAANMVQATKIRRRDQRVFKDGIFLVEKNVVEDEEA